MIGCEKCGSLEFSRVEKYRVDYIVNDSGEIEQTSMEFDEELSAYICNSCGYEQEEIC
jgi:hypothetical protein